MGPDRWTVPDVDSPARLPPARCAQTLASRLVSLTLASQLLVSLTSFLSHICLLSISSAPVEAATNQFCVFSSGWDQPRTVNTATGSGSLLRKRVPKVHIALSPNETPCITWDLTAEQSCYLLSTQGDTSESKCGEFTGGNPYDHECLEQCTLYPFVITERKTQEMGHFCK